VQPCACLEAPYLRVESAAQALTRLRALCPALHSVFLPQDMWCDFWRWRKQEDEVAAHRSVLLLALERGHLGRFTSPVHKYLLDGEHVRSGVPIFRA